MQQRVLCLCLFSILSISFSVIAAKPFHKMALGTTKKDLVDLSEIPELKHIADASSNLKLSLSDIFLDDFTFQEAPNPQELLITTQAENPDFNSNKKLSIMSYNIALLEAKIVGIAYIESPYLDDRAPLLANAIFQTNRDVIMLQEVWRDEDVDRFMQAAQENNYYAYASDRSDSNDGLMTFIKLDSIDEKSEINAHSQVYKTQNMITYFPGPGVKYGFQRTAFTHKKFGKVNIFNTHLIPTPGEWVRRTKQARELGLTVNMLTETDVVSLTGGDMNAAPYYTKNDWRTKSDLIESHFWKNALAYPFLLHYGDMSDLLVMGRDAENAMSDVTQANFVANYIEDNGRGHSWCMEIEPTTFTGCDCNSLFKEQYEGMETPARLDHLMMHDKTNTVRVKKSGLDFTHKIAINDDVIAELSDHYAIYAELERV